MGFPDSYLDDLIRGLKGDQDAISVETSFPEDNPFGREYEVIMWFLN